MIVVCPALDQWPLGQDEYLILFLHYWVWNTRLWIVLVFRLVHLLRFTREASTFTSESSMKYGLVSVSASPLTPWYVGPSAASAF